MMMISIAARKSDELCAPGKWSAGDASEEVEIAHLAGFDQLSHRTHGLFNRNGFINTMLVVKIDHVHAQPLEAGVACLLHILRRAFYAEKFAVWSARRCRTWWPAQLCRDGLLWRVPPALRTFDPEAIHIGVLSRKLQPGSRGDEWLQWFTAQCASAIKFRHAHAASPRAETFSPCAPSFL